MSLRQFHLLFNILVNYVNHVTFHTSSFSPILQLFYFISNFRISLLFIVKRVDYGISYSKTETEC